ncbi:MAG: NAD(P)/FAD-dependent oxidoreductase, partial [Solirubrobacteraceae bacterium]
GSGRAQGSLRVQGRHESELPLAQEALRLWAAAAEEGEFEFVRGGNLYFQTRPEELAVLRGLVEKAHAGGLTAVELLDATQTRELIPSATGPFLGAMWSPVDAHCQPRIATEYYAGKAKAAGAEIRYGVKALRVLETADRVSGVLSTAGTVQARAVVVAGGVWTPHLARSVGLRIPIMPVVMSELETGPCPPLFAQTVRAFGFGARQRPDGRLVISAGLGARVSHGVSLEDLSGLRFWLPRAASFRKSLRLRLDAGRIAQQIRARAVFDTCLVPAESPEPPVDEPLVNDSLARLSTVIPALKAARPARSWAGLVDMTPDGLPVIDGGCGPAGLTIITGLCGHGFTLGPVLGAIAADLALDGASARPIEPFRLARYGDRNVQQPEMII